MSETTPYIPHNPGDLITAEDWNDVQVKIKDDITTQVKDAIEKIDTVPNADNAHKLENKTADELSSEILEKARQEIPQRTGYRILLKRLKPDEIKVIKHELSAFPLVDIYILFPFKVVCSEDDQKSEENVFFYLYHSSEKKIRFTKADNTTESVEIEPIDNPPWRLPFADLLSLYQVKYTDTSSLGDLETEFWKAFFADPNDQFDDDDYCHSPWFDRCCGEKRTVADLKSRGDWDDLWLKTMPVKLLYAENLELRLGVTHFDLNSTGIIWSPMPAQQVDKSVQTAKVERGDKTTLIRQLGDYRDALQSRLTEAEANQVLPVMVLLKV
jgi:hypothetical protein